MARDTKLYKARIYWAIMIASAARGDRPPAESQDEAANLIRKLVRGIDPEAAGGGIRAARGEAETSLRIGKPNSATFR